MTPSPQVFLRAIFEERQARNPRYSMRAFARDITISQTMLVQVLAGKRCLSAEMALQIARRLQLPGAEANVLLDAVVFDALKSPESRALFQAMREKA